MKAKTILLTVLILLVIFSGWSIFTTAQSSGGGGSSGAKIFYIDDTFKIGWVEEADNYEAHYKVWKIEEQQGENITIFTLVPGGGITFHSLDRHFISLGSTGKLIINEIYVSGDDRWISVSLENAEFKEESTVPSTPSSSGGGGGGSDSCFKYYTCDDGTKVQYCEFVKEETPSSCTGTPPVCTGGSVSIKCVCEENPESLCPEIEKPTSTYFKSCSYIWDSSNYVGQNIKISASIKDSTGNSKSDSVEVEVVNSSMGGSGGGHSMSGQNLEIYINSPRGDKVSAGAVEIKISAKGPNKLENMSLAFSGENWGAGFPISNRNCVSGGSSSGGGSGGGNTCEKYYTCEDGTEVQYCEIVKQYDENGNVVGAGCGCKSHPERLCTSPSSGGSGGGSGEPTEIPSSGGGGGGSGGNNETPIICNGCILGDKCVPVGYRTDDKYCNIESELVSQFDAEDSCNNNFECSTNLCIDNQCVSSGVWQKFIRWLSRLFG